MTRASVSLLLMLVACGGPEVSTAQRQCEIAADNDPAVQRAIQQYTATASYATYNIAPLAEARKQAVVRCLRARGLAPRGGVEAVKPPS